MKKINDNLKKTFILYVSLIGSMFFGILVSVLNAKILGAVQFGIFKYVQNILNFLVVIFSFGFFYSSGRLAAIETGAALKSLCAASSLIAMILATALIAIYIPMASFAENFSETKRIWIAMMFGIPYLYALFQQSSAVNLLQGSGYIYRLSIIRLMPNVFYSIFFLLTSIILEVSANGALVCVALSVILATLISQWNILQLSTLKISLLRIIEENKNYGFSVYIGGVANVGSIYLATFFLGIYTGMEEVGYYGLAMTLCIPLQMLIGVVGSVMFKSFASMQRIPLKLSLAVWVSSIFSVVVFYIFIDIVVNSLYGNEYSSVTAYASIMCFASCFLGLGEFYTRFLSAKGVSQPLKYAGICSGFLGILGYWIGGREFGTLGIIYSYVLSSFIYLLMVFLAYSINHRDSYA